MTTSVGRGLGSLIPAGAKRTADRGTMTILSVPIAQVVPNPHQPRRRFDHAELEDLMNSIREHGILQPLVVIKVGGGYQLISGERRFRAAQIIGMKSVPAIVRDATTQQQLELAIVENVQRKDLNPIERAAAYQALIDEFGLTQEQVARRVGKSRAAVANSIRLLALPKEIVQAIAEEKITEGHAKVIAGQPTASDQLKLYHRVLSDGLTVRSGEALVRRSVGRKKAKPANPVHIAAEEDLRERFGTRVQIDRSGRVGTITIEFYSDEELRTLLQRLRRA